MMHVIDNFLPEDVYQELQKKYQNPLMQYGWKSSTTGSDPHGHWNLRLTGGGLENLADISDQFNDVIAKVWNHIKNTYPSMHNTVPIRCYINGATYGVDSYFHTDSTRDSERTIVLYLNEVWKLDWAGETVVVDSNGEIIKSVIPKRNRAFIFPGKMKHCARGVSRICYDLRKTFMFKTRDIRTPTFEKLSSFLYKNGAMKKGHKRGTLHDHLVRVYQILEDKNLPEEICLGGGLHSVFGTTAFKDNIFTFDDVPKIEAEFGTKATSLATMFASINRPLTLESPVQSMDDNFVVSTREQELLGLPSSAFNALRCIECANLIDQNMLNQEKYPNLFQFWQSVTITK